MRNEKGFSLVELLIVVAIIAIIAAIAVPSLLTSKQAANEASAIQGCRTIGSAQIAYSATNNQQYTTVASLAAGNFVDSRFTASTGTGYNGYFFADAAVTGATGAGCGAVPTGFQVTASPATGSGRFTYGICPDQVVRWQGAVSPAILPSGVVVGSPIGK